MSAANNGGPAFPVHGGYEGDDPRNLILGGGVSVRDYFAAAALQGFIACHTGSDVCTPDPKHSAGRAYEYADAMLAERAK